MDLRRIVIALCACLALLAAACSESDARDGDGSADAATATAQTATTQTATPPSPSPTAAGATTRLGTPTGAPHTQRPPDFAPLPGATADFGVLDGSVYRVEMPDDWNGDLVLYAHGVRLDGNELSVGSPNRALRERWIAEGYAWAASSYSENGYVPGLGADDTNALLDYVTATYGKPGRTYLYGVSMGGHVATLLLEHFPERYDGALAVCGAVAGQEQIDYLVAWGMAAEYISGVTLPTGKGTAAMTAALVGALPQALGSLDAPTERGERFISVARELSGGERPFFLEGLRLNYQLNFGLLLLDPNRTTLAGRAATNAGIDYEIDDDLGISDRQLNEGVRRLPADPAARDATAHPDAVPTTGRLADPLITLHNTGDLFVPITNEISYREKAEAAGAGDLLVQRAIRDAGHCAFSDAELTTAWEDLVGWVEDGDRPGGDDLTGDLEDVGRAYTNPLRPGDPGTR